MGDLTTRTCYHFVGYVQHRGFRYACWVCAQKAGVTGWVRNERNGTVTAEVQGSPAAQRAWLARLTELVEGYGEGWSVGNVRAVDDVPGENGFAVRRY